MPLTFNWRHVEKKDLSLAGDLDVGELDLEGVDECIRVSLALTYVLTVQMLPHAFLVRGRLALPVEMTCVRCLKVFRRTIELPDWICHLAREGEDQVPIVNDLVDLTPYVREDILLAFPQHPLCETECNGLPRTSAGSIHQRIGDRPEPEGSSAWAKLNKLKL